MKEILKRYVEKLKNRFVNAKTARILVDLLFLLGSIFFFCVATMPTHVRIISFVVSFIIYKGLTMFINVTDEVMNKMPNWGRRFTKKLEDGSIVVEKGRIHEAILFLYSVEEYMERSR